MKQAKWICYGTFVPFILSFFLNSNDVSAREGKTAIGRVIFVKGNAWIGRGSQTGDKTKAEVDQKITDGDILITEADSEMKIIVGKKEAALHIKPDSLLKLVHTPQKTWLVDLTKGSVLSYIRKGQKRPNFYRIKTPAAVMGVRGTIFFAKYNSDPNKGLFLCTCSGSVSLDDRMTITSFSHGAPKLIRATDEPLFQRLRDANKGNEHSNEEAAVLVKAIN
jgi:hypothetical protein